ncbi:MAG: TIGR04013 family B12-binding domain/radical SAM domain-containing protein [Crenarchaeota archaeon]|nr:TIGR04013 family B12-binding domain/radical SAM domain-containing protein [Thermoproteota archaeon]
MNESTFFIFAEEKDTRYSVRAVLAALESRRDLEAIHVKGIERAIQEARRLLERGARVVLATSLMTTMIPSIMNLIDEMQRLRRSSLGKRLILVAGGAHATCDPLGTVERLGFDVAVVGEAEETIVDIADTITDRWIEGLEGVKGLVVRIGDTILYTGRRRDRVELDAYPPFPYWRRLFTPIEIVRGCPWGCRYCATWFIHGSRERYRSIETVEKYAELMLRSGLRDLRFIAPNSLAYGEEGRCRPRLDLVDELLARLNKLTGMYGGRVFFGSFPSEVRPEYVTEESMRILRGRIANKRIIVGAQSGSDEMLRRINRGHSVDDVINAVEIARKHGFGVDVDFIFGLPGETESDVEETIKLIELLAGMGARIHAHTFLPLPGTPFESAPPGSARPYIEKGLLRYLGKGLVYGYWERQERLAKQIHELYRRGIVLGLRGWRLLYSRARRGIPCAPHR